MNNIPEREADGQSRRTEARVEFPTVDRAKAQSRAAFVAEIRDSSQWGLRESQTQSESLPDNPEAMNSALQGLSISENSARGRGRGHRSAPPPLYGDQQYRPWSASNAPNVPYSVSDPYGVMRMPPGSIQMQWMPYPPPPAVGYGMYGEPRQGLYYDHRMPGMPGPPFHPGFFPPQHLPHPMHGAVPGQRFSAPPIHSGYYVQSPQQAPSARQRPPRPSKAPQQPSEAYEFSVEEAEEQPDTCRKTLMLRNIPNKYSIHMLLEMLDNCHQKEPDDLVYDFCYLPIDFKNRCNLGYAFVNFVDAKSTLECYRTFHEKRWNDFNSKKVCEVKYGRVQGREALIEHFKNSKFPSNDTDSLPLLFEKVTKEDGSKEIRSVPLHSRHPS